MDPNDRRLDPYRDLRRAGQGDCFIVEGYYLFERLVASAYDVESVVVSESTRERVAPLVPANTSLYVLSNSDLKRLTGYDFHRGVLACGKRRPSLHLGDIVSQKSARDSLVILPHVHDQSNLGSILRNCAAFGIGGVVLGPGSTDPLSRRTLRVSMGASLSRSIIRVDNVHDVLRRLRSEFDIQVIAATTSPEAVLLDEFKPTTRLAIVLGSEGEGVSAEHQMACDLQVRIPMAPATAVARILPTDSLNVAVSSGILLYHFRRQLAAGSDVSQ